MYSARSSRYARALSRRSSVAGDFGWDAAKARDPLRCMLLDMCREGDPWPPLGDRFRDTRRCSFRYCLRLLPTPALEKLPARCAPDGARGEPSSCEALMLRRRLSLRFRAMCTSWLGSTVGRGGELPRAAGGTSSRLLLVLD